MADEPRFGRVNVHQAKDALSQFLADVCKGKVRLEIVDDGHTCVLISKDELDSLEGALEILANTSEVQKIATGIAALTCYVAQGPLVLEGTGSAN